MEEHATASTAAPADTRLGTNVITVDSSDDALTIQSPTNANTVMAPPKKGRYDDPAQFQDWT